MAQQEEFLPACPIPWVIQPHERIEWLKEVLKDSEQQRQRTNILALIRMYETGELGPLVLGTRVWVCNGKIIDDPLASKDLRPPESAIWLEVGLHLHYIFANLLPFL